MNWYECIVDIGFGPAIIRRAAENPERLVEDIARLYPESIRQNVRVTGIKKLTD